MAMAIGPDESPDFKLGADQVDRLYLGMAFVWPNIPIDDFEASDNLVSELKFTWTDSNEVAPHSYDLYENDIRIYDDLKQGQTLAASEGTADYYIRALYAGGHHIQSNTDEGTSLSGIPPSAITNFSATDNLELEVQCFWSNATGDPTPTYEVWRDGNIIDQNVSSGYRDIRPAGTSDYYVKAVSTAGETDSNHDSGTALEKGVCIPGSTVFNVPGAYDITVPSGVKNMDFCMTGAGGSGSVRITIDNAGGGFAGQERSGNIAVTPGQPLRVTVGHGGAPIGGGQIGNGNAGSNSGLGSVVAGGGSGGQAQGGYTGQGGPGPGGCGGGGHRDGSYAGTGSDGAFGGQATSFGSGGGGSPTNASPGGIGAGGGATMGGGAYSGSGGNGYVRVSWDCTLIGIEHPPKVLSELNEAEMTDLGIIPLDENGKSMTYKEWKEGI